MRIIKRGHTSDDTVARLTCKKCKSLLEIERRDVTTLTDRNDSFMMVHCPVCMTGLYPQDSDFSYLRDGVEY
jgi:RNase P subunit RPR2